MPKTKLGKWAGALLAVFLVSLIALLIFIHVIGLRRGSVGVLIPGIKRYSCSKKAKIKLP